MLIEKAQVMIGTKARKKEIEKIIKAAKRLAIRYYALTGRPLGITGEIAEWEAIRLLRLKTAPVRQPGYDALRGRTRLQIKSRSFDQAKPAQRLGQIRLDRPWDAVLLVVLDMNLKIVAIYEAKRPAIRKALRKPGSKARNERGLLAVSQFKKVATQVWPKTASEGVYMHE